MVVKTGTYSLRVVFWEELVPPHGGVAFPGPGGGGRGMNVRCSTEDSRDRSTLLTTDKVRRVGYRDNANRHAMNVHWNIDIIDIMD